MAASKNQIDFHDHLPFIEEKLRDDGLIRELCNIFRLLMDADKELKSLKVLNLLVNDMSDAVLSHLNGLINLESLNLDSCRIGDKGLVHLAGLVHLKCLELSDIEVGNNGLRHLSG
ncbi:unnamed protein product [Lactuca saligna]|uniref:Uncharacterized protein n=1 Tax=Lactuca saligna TaxID=75948 RepID=A0AA36EL28_LACSI|nr:unnamed protein product [Lactuca saligna]